MDRQRTVGARSRVEAKAIERPDERRSTELCAVGAGRDGWLLLALVIESRTRRLRGWRLSRTGMVSTAAAALDLALITRLGTLGRVQGPFLLRSDSDLLFSTAGTPHCVAAMPCRTRRRSQVDSIHSPRQPGREPDFFASVDGYSR
jgi:hypothetical protein